jgi:uncharacterized protein with beta-barrel porin domain
VTGSLSFSAASTYLVEVSPGSADRVNVTGVASLGGATVNAVFATGSYAEKQYTILSAGSITGTFGSLVNSNLPTTFKSSLSYDTANAYLNLLLDFTPDPTPAPVVNSGLDRNQTSVANALSAYFARSGSIPVVFGSLTPAGLTMVSGETAVGVQHGTIAAVSMFLGLLTDPFADRGQPLPTSAIPFADDGARRDRPREAMAMFAKAAPAAATLQRWSVWAAGYGGSQTIDGNAAQGSHTTTSRIYGTAVGVAYRLSPLTEIGFALAGGASNVGIGIGSGRSDLFQAAATLRHQIGTGYLNAALAYGWQDVATERNVAGALSAGFGVNSWSGRIEAGSRYAVPAGFGLTPYAAAQVISFALPGYAERSAPGNPFALSYEERTVTASRSELGLRSDRSYALGDSLLTLRGRAAWVHEFDPERGITATFQTLPGASFAVGGAALAPDAALLSANAELGFRSGVSLGASFDGEFSDRSRSYAGKGLLRYRW